MLLAKQLPAENTRSSSRSPRKPSPEMSSRLSTPSFTPCFHREYGGILWYGWLVIDAAPARLLLREPLPQPRARLRALHLGPTLQPPALHSRRLCREPGRT